MNKILYEKETLFLEIISRGYGNRDLYNLFNFWNKVRENLSKFSINKNLVNTIKEIEKQVANLESNIELKEEEKQKINSVKLNKNSNNHVYIKKIVRNQNELNKSEKQHMLKENVKIKKVDLNKKENTFIFCEEILDKNIFQISKNGQNIISFIDIDLFLQRIAQGKNIYDVLDMTIDDANVFFKNQPRIMKYLEVLKAVGLGYMKLGQSATTLSGGEAQRIKLASELNKRATGKTLYLLDEPTVGLHWYDLDKLIKIINKLADAGNTILIIEHNLDLIKTVDHIIDLGPQGGDEGGTIVAEGTPEEIAENEKSLTGLYLKKMLKQKQDA